jgi:hypothetical protein
LLAADPRPHFVRLDAARRQVSKHAILILGADATSIHQQPQNGLFANSGDADRAADRAAIH